MDEKIMTVMEMAARLKICRNTAYLLAAKPEFYPSFKIGRKILVDSDQLEKWILEQGARKVEVGR